MKIRPLQDRVIVKRVQEEEKTKGGIIIPDTAKEKPQEGEVIAVGPGARDDHGKLVVLELKAGGQHFALHRLLLGGVGNDDAALGLFFLLDAADQHPVLQRTKSHAIPP